MKTRTYIPPSCKWKSRTFEHTEERTWKIYCCVSNNGHLLHYYLGILNYLHEIDGENIRVRPSAIWPDEINIEVFCHELPKEEPF